MMISASELKDLKEIGIPILLLAGFVYAMWKLIPAAMDKHEAIVTRIAADNKAAVEKLTTEHKATVDGLVREFRAELKELRDRNEEEHERRDVAINKLADAVDRISERVSK